jgi:hypothetical protein
LAEGSEAADKEIARAAEGIIAKVAKEILPEAENLAGTVGRDATGAAGKDAAHDLPALRMEDAQFGKKVGKHAQDFGLDPSDPAVRYGSAVTSRMCTHTPMRSVRHRGTQRRRQRRRPVLPAVPRRCGHQVRRNVRDSLVTPGGKLVGVELSTPHLSAAIVPAP